METESTIKTSFVLSGVIHAAIFSLFTFVMVLDLGSVIPPVEVTYIGSSGERLPVRGAAFKKISMEASPLINLPDRVFATESVVSGVAERISLVPAFARKVDPKPALLNVSEDRVKTVETVRLNVKKEYTMEGSLSARKIVIQPPGPEYPSWAVRGGLESVMKLRVTVSPQGVVEKVESLQATGFPRVDLEASRYIKQWRFESRAGDTESETGVISIKFKLK